VHGIAAVEEGLGGASELLDLAEGEDDQDTANAVVADVEGFNTHVEKLEFQRMFSGELDPANCFVDIQAGAGGTEAQDWAEMMLRMYLRWCESRGWKTELMEASAGDVAGIKSATFRVEGDYAYGWLKTEIGVHRLVRNTYGLGYAPPRPASIRPQAQPGRLPGSATLPAGSWPPRR